MTVTKKELEERFGISHNTVRDTLRVCGLDTSRREYSEEEIEQYFAVARKLLEEGKSYDEVSKALGRSVASSEEAAAAGAGFISGPVADAVMRQVEEGGRVIVRQAVEQMIERFPALVQEAFEALAAEGAIDQVFARSRQAYYEEMQERLSTPRGLFGAAAAGTDNEPPSDEEGDVWESDATRIE